MPPCLLLTRPQLDSERFVHQLREAGFHGQIVISPVLGICLHPPGEDQLSEAKTLVVTSQHAVTAVNLATKRRDWPIRAVGPRTAAVAREAGFSSVMQSGGDASALLADLLRDRPEEPILHLRGKHIAADIAQVLRAQGMRADSLVVYEQVSRPLSSDGWRQLEGDGDILLAVFSPRSSQLLAEMLSDPTTIRARLHLVAISQAAADAFKGISIDQCCIAAQPDGPSMLRAILALQAKLEP
ncbi:MAG: uroporphyrinogen-III synthase [Roseinatronobacter sp.]